MDLLPANNSGRPSIAQTLQTGYNEDLWYDWFCKDSQLETRGKSLLNKLKKIAFSNRFDASKTYVIFKNNAPLVGRLYDDFRIVDMDTRNVIYTVTPSSGFTSKLGQAEVWGRENDFQRPLVTGTWKDVVKFFTGR